jgi:hypothetical protein
MIPIIVKIFLFILPPYVSSFIKGGHSENVQLYLPFAKGGLRGILKILSYPRLKKEGMKTSIIPSIF